MSSNKGYLEIHIEGKKGEIPLTPDTYDISELRNLLGTVEKLLFPGDLRNRPAISYEVKDGSVRHILKTSLQAIIGLNAILGQILKEGNINFLEVPSGQAFSALQEMAKKQNYSFEISTSVEKTNTLKIDPTTSYILAEQEWVDAEFYFYGDVTDMGGQVRSNVHVSLPGLGSFRIETPKETIRAYESNPIYKPLGIRASGRQNRVTGDIDKNTLKFKEFVSYHAAFDELYLKSLINKARTSWADVTDVDSWVRDLRGADA